MHFSVHMGIEPYFNNGKSKLSPRQALFGKRSQQIQDVLAERHNSSKTVTTSPNADTK